MTKFAAFEVFCTEDKFWAVQECFSDLVECDERLANFATFYTDDEVEVFNVKVPVEGKRHSVKFSVKQDDSYSMLFANYMVDCWNK